MNLVYRFFATLDSHGPTLLRLLLATVFFVHGGQKTWGWLGGDGWSATLLKWTAANGLNLPYPLAVLGLLAEALGAAGLLLGFLTRLAALGIVGAMAAAIATVHGPAGFLAPQGYEYPLTLGVAALSLVFTGGGKWSLDRAITRLLLPPYDNVLFS